MYVYSNTFEFPLLRNCDKTPFFYISRILRKEVTLFLYFEDMLSWTKSPPNFAFLER